MAKPDERQPHLSRPLASLGEADHTFLEARESLSEPEERFERARHTVGLFLGPIVLFALYLMPMQGLSYQAHALAAILGGVVVYWVAEPIPIPVTAVLGAVLCALMGVAPISTALAPFADPTVFLFLGSFILAEAMAVHGLDRRFAFGILSISWVGNSTARILLAYGAITAFVSMWISNTATAAMIFPIGLGIIYAMEDMMKAQTGKMADPTKLRFGTGMMLMAAYAASVGGIGTPVGTPPNLIGIALIEKAVRIKIPFFQWILLAVPVMIALAVAAGMNPIPPALGATLGASWGFMLPVSTPPNAIVYGSGMVPITKMIRAGIFFDVIGCAIIWIGLRIMLPLVGLA